MWPTPQAMWLLALATSTQAILQTIPGSTWTATNTGHHVQAHGAGVVEVSGVYYMVGEDKTSGTLFQNINCYSSTNLVEWTLVNRLLTLQPSGDLGPNRIVERPKIVYNDKTAMYVMYMHIDNAQYSEAKVGVATSTQVCGNYSYQWSFQPLGQQSRDIGLFKDDDGSAYLLTEDRPNGLRIDALSDDYLNVTESTYLWSDHLESPAILAKDGYYFMFGSHLTGWATNDNVYSFATSLSGPWSEWTSFADVGSNTYNSQTSFILPFGNSPIYLGDRWEAENLLRSTYVWLPLEITGTTVRMADRGGWVPNVESNTWNNAPPSYAIEGTAAALSGGAKVVNCSGCTNGKAVGWVGGPSDGTLTFSGVNGTGSRTTIRFSYVNGDQGERLATVTTNGKSQTVAFLPTQDGQTVGNSSVNCDLSAGNDNIIVVAGIDGGYGPDIDYISVAIA